VKVGDLVVYKAPGLDNGIAVITKVDSNPCGSLSYKIWMTWQNGVEGEQYSWQMKVVS